MPTLITLAQIRARANAKSFSRGEQYFRQNAISDTVKRGNVVEGFCEGSEPQPYHVQVVLNEKGIVQASCTCDYSFDGDCKHVVALLLMYLHRPEDFEARPSIENILQGRTKEALIQLIRAMVQRYPDLQTLVDRPIPSSDTKRTTIDTSVFRKELRHVFQSYSGYYDDDWDVLPADSVLSVARSALDFIDFGDWQNASAIYRSIFEEFLDGNYEHLLDDEGELISALNEVVGHLRNCLSQPAIQNSEAERRVILNILLKAFIWDTDFGGHGLADEAPDIVFQYAKPSDIPIIRDQLLAAQADHAERPYYSNWGQEVYNHVLMELDTLENVDPEVILERLRQNGQYYLLVTKLLDLKRLDEALVVIKSHIQGNIDPPRVLRDLQQKGYGDIAVQQAEVWLTARYEDFLVNWLLDHLKASQDNRDDERILKWQLVRMEKTTFASAGLYPEIKEVALRLGQWDTVRPNLLKKIEGMGRYDMLIHAYLYDEDWDQAWATLPKTLSKSPYYAYMSARLDLEVAKQSYMARPEKALPVYQKYVRANIDRRQRSDYAEAAALLTAVREIYQQMDDMAGWQQYINDLRTEFKKLPAFQDELHKAKL